MDDKSDKGQADNSATKTPNSELPLERKGNYRPLRVWPAILFLVGALIAKTITRLPSLAEDGPANLWMAPAFGPLLCGILILLWWLLGSRASLRERALGFLGVVLAAVIVVGFLHPSMKGPPVIVMMLPTGIVAFAVAAVLLARWLSFRRTMIAVVCAFLGFGFSTLMRNNGMWGNFAMDLNWRWEPSVEDTWIAGEQTTPTVSIASFGESIDAGLADPAWPAFRGPNRDGSYVGSRLETDWESNPPKQLWKIPVGPAWSSFSVAGPLLFTQEQRGEFETVVCYSAESGQEIWTHQIESRFFDTLGGDGPRATPTVHGDALFVLGASGQLRRLNAKTSEVEWSADLRDVAKRKPPEWGFCSSPLVSGANVIVNAGGPDQLGTLAFDVATGQLVWSAPSGDHAYGSPQQSTLAGSNSILMLTNTGLDVLDPQSGDVRLAYKWKSGGYRSLQPSVLDGNKVLLPSGMGVGTRCVQVTADGNSLVAEERWTSLRLKPDFNDMVVHKGAVYGFDGEVFTCIDAETGERNWKRGRYGKGQVLLLPDQDLLMVMTELGEITLLKANPDSHVELGSFQAIDGRTWNHPVLVNDRLYVRNSAEAACYQLTLQTVESDQ